MHDHGDEQTSGPVVDPHHEHPVGRQLPDKETEAIQSHEKAHGKTSGVRRGDPDVVRQEVPRSPRHPDQERCGNRAVASAQCRNGEPCPAELFEDAHRNGPRDTEDKERHRVAHGDEAGKEQRRRK